jgi:hypothetical protein
MAALALWLCGWQYRRRGAGHGIPKDALAYRWRQLTRCSWIVSRLTLAGRWQRGLRSIAKRWKG